MTQTNFREPLGDYLMKYKREAGQTQTHTWFPPGKGAITLSVPFDHREEFLQRLYDYITHTKQEILENPKRGKNSITEKIIKGIDKFRMFADIDFGVDLFEKHDLPTEEDVLKSYMSDLVHMYDAVVEEIYGVDFLCDRVLTIRLPYKIHIIYPSIVVNKKIAEYIADRFTARLKADDRFAKILTQNPKLVDKSVYTTGLRMPGMHKSIMGKGKVELECATHENLFGENSYVHCYRFADADTFETLPKSYDLFKNSSILVDPREEYTVSVHEDEFASLTAKNKGKAPSKAVLVGRGDVRRDVDAYSSFGTIPGLDDDGDSTTMDERTQHMLINLLGGTMKYLRKVYNHLINEEKIILREKRDTEGNLQASLVFPLETKECHFAQRQHESNHQYLLLDRDGCRQKCHDCAGEEHKLVKPSRMPQNVKEELVKLNVLRPDVVVKTKKKEPSEEQKMSAVDDLVERVRHYYPKNDLSIDRARVVINDLGVHIGLHDLWCEVCKKRHDIASTYLWATETGKMCLKCESNPGIGLFYPDPPLVIDHSTRQFFFSNCSVSFVNNNIHNYGDNTGDVSVDFEEEQIFEDEVLNHLIYESLAATTWPIVKVIHHLAKRHFNCTRSGEWYVYKRHKWHRSSESSMLYFVSEEVSHYYRQVRDYYKENTESPDLRQKRTTHIQKIVDKLTNVNSKNDVVKEAKTYFYEQDYYCTENGAIHFEERLDEHRNLLCFTNGVYDLDNDLFRDGSPYDFVTLSVNFEYVDRSDPIKRTMVEKFFDDIQPDEDEREYLLLFLSSMLHGTTKEETFHIFTGAAANGKSLLRDLIKAALGEYFVSIPPNLLTRERPSSSSPQPEILLLKGKRAVFGSEPEANQKINTGYMKMITGNDPLSARNLHSNEIITFLPQFKLVLLCNDIPLMDNNDLGTWRRSRIKEFPVVFCDNPRTDNKYEKKIDLTMKERIAECKQEFILYLMEYYRRYRDMERLKPTARVNKMVEKHKKKSNSVLQFIEEKTEEAPDDSGENNLLLTELYSHYTTFMRQENPGEPILIKSRFTEELKKIRNIEYSRDTRRTGRQGKQDGVKRRRLKFIENVTNDE